MQFPNVCRLISCETMSITHNRPYADARRWADRFISCPARMTAAIVAATAAIVVALPSAASTGLVDPVIVQRVLRLTRDTKWTAIASIKVKFPTFHPQGMVRIGGNFYVSSVEITTMPIKQTDPRDQHDRTTGSGKGHLFKIGPDGTLLGDLVLGEGAIYHPGGIDFDGGSIWVPVAEYRPGSRSIVYRVDPATMRVTGSFRFADHIGAIIHDMADDSLRGMSWGSRSSYRWPLDHDGLPANPSTARGSANPAQYIDYQDCHYVGSGRMLCSGVGEYRLHATNAVFQLGGIDLVDLRDDRPVWQVPIELRSPSGLVMTQNPFFLEARQAGVRVWFMPDDNDSTLYVFDAATDPRPSTTRAGSRH